MIKECVWCGNKFESNAKSIYKQRARKFCSAKCASDYKMAQPGFKEKISKIQKEVQNRGEVKEKNSRGVKNKWADPDFRNNITAAQTEAQNRPDVLKETKKRFKEITNRPDNKKRMTQQMTNNWKDATFVDKIINGVKEWEARGGRSRHSELMIEKWKDENFANKMFKTSVKYKDYELPSGKIVKLQGYEPQVLDELLTKYDEEDVVCEVKDINKELGKILYTYKGNEHRYYPDFYIKSTNTIIEVKSQWTFNVHKEKNLAKERACRQQGFNFEFNII